MNEVSNLFAKWSTERNVIIELSNYKHAPVAALYLDKLQIRSIIVTELTNSSEKYYLYLDGVGIFFTYYRKLTKEDN